jgi:hypothetical protein
LAQSDSKSDVKAALSESGRGRGRAIAAGAKSAWRELERYPGVKRHSESDLKTAFSELLQG